MKKSIIKSFAVAAFGLAAMTATAQPPMGAQGGRPEHGQNGRGERPSREQMVEMQVERTTKELDLSADQQAKMKELYQGFNADMEKMMGNRESRPTQEEMKAMQEEMKTKRQELSESMKAILTPEQAEKWETMNQRNAPQSQDTDKQKPDKGGKDKRKGRNK